MFSDTNDMLGHISIYNMSCLTKRRFIDHIAHNILNAAKIVFKLGNRSPVFVVIIQFFRVLG